MEKSHPNLRFKEFEGGWTLKRINDIAELTSSKRVYLSDYVDKGVPFFRGKEISDLKNNLDPTDILYISDASYKEFKQKYGVPAKNDILITAVGTLGNVWRIKDNKAFYFKDGNLIWLRNILEHSEFLEVLLEVKHSDIEKSSIGSSQRALTMVELRKLVFSFPTLSEQQKIASFLSAFDEKIRRLKRKKELLELYKKGVMQQLFSGKLRFKDENGRMYSRWDIKRIGDVCAVKRGASPRPITDSRWFSEQSEIGWVRISDVTKSNKFLERTEQYLSNEGISKSRLVKKGNMIMSICATIGKPIYTNFDVCIHDGFVVFEDLTLDREFLYYYLDSIQSHWYNYGQPGTQVNLNSGIVANEKVPVPSFIEQQRIANFMSAVDVKINSVVSQLNRSQAFKKGLLQQMFV